MSGPNAGNKFIFLQQFEDLMPPRFGPPPRILIGKQIIRTYSN